MTSSPITSLSHPPSSSLLASASSTHLSLYTLPTLSTSSTTLTPTKSHPLPALQSVCFPTTSTLYSATSRGLFSVHSVNPDLSLSTPYTVPAAHSAHSILSIASLDETVATAGKDGVIKLWTPSAEAKGRLVAHRYDVRSVSLASGGVLASGGRDKTVRLWDLRDESNVATFKGHSSWVHSVAVFSDPFPGIVSCAGDKTVRIWDLRTEKMLKMFTGHQYRVWAVAQWNGLAVSASTDATIRVWDMQHTEQKEIVLDKHTDSVLAVDIHDAYVWSGCEDGSVMMWDINGVHGRQRQLIDVGEVMRKSGAESDVVAKALDDTPLIAEKPAEPAGRENGSLIAVEEHEAIGISPIQEPVQEVSAVDRVIELKAVLSQKPEQTPQYDKSAAELVSALRTIRELETQIKVLNDSLSQREREVAALKQSLEQRDVKISQLERQLEANNSLLEAAKVRQLLEENPRKTDVNLDYEEPANKIGAVSDELCRLKERLEAMVAN